MRTQQKLEKLVPDRTDSSISVDEKVKAAGRGPFLFPTYLGRSKGLCLQGMSVYDLFLSLEPGFLSYYFALETHRLRKCPWARKRQEKHDRGNAPINSKLQHPPRAYPGHLTVHRARGGGNLNVALEGWGI